MPDHHAEPVMHCVASAFGACHQRSVTHCDARLTNVLVCEHGVVKLSEFGPDVQVGDLDGTRDVH